MNNINTTNGGVHKAVDEHQTAIKNIARNYDEYKKILIVREPYSRLVSGFLSVIVRQLPHLATLSVEDYIAYLSTLVYLPVYMPRVLPLDVRNAMLCFKDNPTFKNFVTLIEKIGMDALDHHLGPQFCTYHCQLFPDIYQMHFDMIITIDDLSKELVKIARSFGKRVDIGHANVTTYNPELTMLGVGETRMDRYLTQHGSNFPTWQYFYDPEILALVNAWYARDFAFYHIALTAPKTGKELLPKVQSIIFSSLPEVMIINTNYRVILGIPTPMAVVEKARAKAATPTLLPSPPLSVPPSAPFPVLLPEQDTPYTLLGRRLLLLHMKFSQGKRAFAKTYKLFLISKQQSNREQIDLLQHQLAEKNNLMRQLEETLDHKVHELFDYIALNRPDISIALPQPSNLLPTIDALFKVMRNPQEIQFLQALLTAENRRQQLKMTIDCLQRMKVRVEQEGLKLAVLIRRIERDRHGESFSHVYRHFVKTKAQYLLKDDMPEIEPDRVSQTQDLSFLASFSESIGFLVF
jgi:hypothetical protein